MKQRHFSMTDLIVLEQMPSKAEMLEPVSQMRARLIEESKAAKELALRYTKSAGVMRVKAEEVWA